MSTRASRAAAIKAGAAIKKEETEPKEEQHEPDENQIVFDPLLEIKLFIAICGHKPVGVSKHLQMACIHQLLTETYNVPDNPTPPGLTPAHIWAHLDRLYDMASLDEAEKPPFPNAEQDFYLPEGDFGQLMQKKEKAVEEKSLRSSSTTPTRSSGRTTPVSSASKRSSRRT